MEEKDVDFETNESQTDDQSEDRVDRVATVDTKTRLSTKSENPEEFVREESRKSVNKESKKSINDNLSSDKVFDSGGETASRARKRSSSGHVGSKRSSKSNMSERSFQSSRISILGPSSNPSRRSTHSKISKDDINSAEKSKTSKGKLLENVSEKIAEIDDHSMETKSEEKSLSECNSSKCFERPESPPNPYNRLKYPNMLAQWPLPDHEEPRIGVANSIASLECGFFPKSPLDHCSCCPKDKDPLNCCANMIRAKEGCCVSEWIRKEFYYKTKSRVERAIMRHKIFLLRGELPKLQEALEERGWVQKYEATKSRTVPYGSVPSLDTISLGDLRQSDGTLNERALIFRLLRHRAPDFIWDCRNHFVDWDCTLRNDTLLNRFQKSFIYTSKLGMAHLLESSHWFNEDGVASVKFPKCYNLTRDPDAFVEEFRRNAAVGLLKWFVEEVKNNRDIVDRGRNPIPVTSIEFALKKCQDWVANERNEDIDDQLEEIFATDREWEEYLNDYEKVLHGNNGIRITSSESPARVIEGYYLKAHSILRKIKEIDHQYELCGMKNIWILKPSDLCCGTGIVLSHRLKDIFQKVNSRPNDYYIVQKYIEHPLLVHRTKFDIRQWYLVTNTFPLTIWMFNEALLRFSSKPYTFDNYHEAIHICNTAVQQKYDERKKRRRKTTKSEDSEESSVRDENWDCEKLNDYLKKVGYEGEPYTEKIFPKMTEAIVLTMLASQEYMDKRKCSFELYGADFMVMEDLSVWLIEINTNPRMHPPGLKITKRLYPAVLESLVKVVFDLPLNPSADTGGFVLAYKQNISEFQPYLGSCMFVFGKAMNLQNTPSKENERKSRGKICNPWGKQHRAWTAPPVMPRARDPGVIDLIDFLKTTRGTIR